MQDKQIASWVNRYKSSTPLTPFRKFRKVVKRYYYERATNENCGEVERHNYFTADKFTQTANEQRMFLQPELTFERVFGKKYRGVEKVPKIVIYENRKLSVNRPHLYKRLAEIINYQNKDEKENFHNNVPEFLRPYQGVSVINSNLWENYGKPEMKTTKELLHISERICYCTPETPLRETIKCMKTNPLKCRNKRFFESAQESSNANLKKLSVHDILINISKNETINETATSNSNDNYEAEHFEDEDWPNYQMDFSQEENVEILEDIEEFNRNY